MIKEDLKRRARLGILKVKPSRPKEWPVQRPQNPVVFGFLCAFMLIQREGEGQRGHHANE